MISAAEFSEQLERDGFIKLPQFLSTEAVTTLIQITDWLYSTVNAAETSGREPRKTAAAEYLLTTNRIWSGLQLDTVREFLADESRDLLRRFDAVVAEIERGVMHLLGDGWEWRPEGSFFRRLTKTPAHVPWHSDAEAASTLKLGPRAISMWVPLVSVGETMPSLEFVRGSHHVMRNPETPMPPDRHRPEEWVNATVAGERIAPRAEPGDVLVFDEFTLHRTQPLSGHSSQRTSCEFRFALPGSSRVSEEVPIDVPRVPKGIWKRLGERLAFRRH
jgi:hypothetical protein